MDNGKSINPSINSLNVVDSLSTFCCLPISFSHSWPGLGLIIPGGFMVIYISQYFQHCVRVDVHVYAAWKKICACRQMVEIHPL